MPNRRSIAATALGAMLVFPGGLAAQSIDVSVPAIDVSVPSISIDISGVPEASDFSIDTDTTVQHNESDFDFVARSIEEAGSAISESLATTAAVIAEGIEEMADALTELGEDIASAMDDLAAIVVLCVDGGTCAPPDPPPQP